MNNRELDRDTFIIVFGTSGPIRAGPDDPGSQVALNDMGAIALELAVHARTARGLWGRRRCRGSEDRSGRGFGGVRDGIGHVPLIERDTLVIVGNTSSPSSARPDDPAPEIALDDMISVAHELAVHT